jgi:SAM-dependent methyltransferase
MTPSGERPSPPPGSTLLGRFLRWFFGHLYTTFAWAYDLVAYAVSLGAWDSWRNSAIPSLGAADPVLELGCGTGHLTRRLLLDGRSAFAVDASRQMTRITAARLHRAGKDPVVVRAQAQALPFSAGVFASSVATFPSEYILDPQTLTEVGRVLRPSGRLVIVVSARIRPSGPLARLARWLFDITGQAPPPEPHWIDPVRRAGFDASIVEMRLAGSDVLQIVAGAPAPSRHATIRQHG